MVAKKVVQQKTNTPCVTAHVPLTFSADVGNGTVKGISSESSTVVSFEPQIATITERRDLEKSGRNPTHSLRTDGKTEVFGLDDVREHGKRETRRRFNAIERYTDPDYFKLLDVLFLHLFANWRGNSDPITPRGIISLPISEFQKTKTVEEIRATVANGKVRTITDHEGCELRLLMNPEDLFIIPESVGALYWNIFDPITLKPRANANPAGLSVVLDLGYMSTDVSTFDGMKFLRDRNTTILVGMGQVVRAIVDSLHEQRGLDETQVDREIRNFVDIPLGAPKAIALPGKSVNVATVYANALDDLANRIAQGVLSKFAEDGVARVLLSGGGAYHLKTMLSSRLSSMGSVSVIEDADTANTCGAFIMLQLKLRG